jgi:hypothetical protein
LVGFTLKSWFPLDEFKASASWEKNSLLTPDMIRPEEFLEDQEKLLREGETMDDDIIRGANPSQAVFWGDGILGCKMRILPGNIVAEPMGLSWEEIEKINFDKNSPWFKKYIEFLDILVKRADDKYPISHGWQDGPVDLAVNLRGHEQIAIDLMLEPKPAQALIERLGTFFIELFKESWKRLPLFHGGYFDAMYHLWAPESIVRMQEDAVAVLSPDLYRSYVKPVDVRIASHFGCAFIHLHATSMIVLDQMLEIPGLRCYEINNDVGGPSIKTMSPYFRMVQRAKKPLMIRGSFTPDELRMLMDSIEPSGLYLHIMINSLKDMEPLRPIVGL